jgi:hypothetical protein
MSKITVFGCGGAGISAIVNNKHYLDEEGVNAVCVDSSDSNIGTVDIKNKYQLKGKNGSGGNQLENIEQFRDSIPDILAIHQPSTFNLVVSSTSGGSGSVASMYLTRELVKRGHATVLVMLATSDSQRRINNTINVFKTLESMSDDINQPLILMLNHQPSSHSRRMGDEGFYHNLRSLIYLFNSKFADIDDMDITNFLFYNKVTKVEPQLVTLSVDEITPDSLNKLRSGKPPVTLLGIVNDKYKEETVIDVISQHSKIGYDCNFVTRTLQTNYEDAGWLFTINNQDKHQLLDEFLTLKRSCDELNAASVTKKLSCGNPINGGFVFED